MHFYRSPRSIELPSIMRESPEEPLVLPIRIPTAKESRPGTRLTYYSDDFLSRQRSSSPSTVHYHDSPSPLIIIPPPAPVSVPVPIPHQSSGRASPDFDAESKYSFTMPQPNTVSQLHPPSYFESDFQTRQEERDRIFEEAQRRRETRFKRLEIQRSAVDKERESQFGTRQSHCRDAFQKSCSGHWGVFRDYQVSRDLGKDMRAKSFLILQSRLQGIFECDLLWYSEQYEAEERVKAGEVAAQKERVLLLFEDMQGVVDDTREKFSAAFTAAIVKWGVQITEEETSMGKVFKPIPILPDISESFRCRRPPGLRFQPHISQPPMIVPAPCGMPIPCMITAHSMSSHSLSELDSEVIHVYAPDDLFVCIGTSIRVEGTDSL